MNRRPALAALALSFALPALAQQPVYPNFPPPPQSADQLPHPVSPAQSPDSANQAPADDNDPGQPQSTPTQPPYPPDQAPATEKPSPYPPAADGSMPADQQSPPAYPPQSRYPAQNPYAQPGYAAPYDGPGALGWVPRGMETLARTAAFHTDFTFDRTMLQFASGMWDGPADPATAVAINRLDGISLHVYHYAAAGMYDPRLLESVRRQYSALGWQHLVTTHSAANGGATDLWISFHHMQATGAVVLFQSPTNLNLIVFSGNLSPVDLLHLRGHFGIPRFAGDRFVPAPGPYAHATPMPR